MSFLPRPGLSSITPSAGGSSGGGSAGLGDLVSTEIFADVDALEAEFPAASNVGKLALIGSSVADATCVYYEEDFTWNSFGSIVNLSSWDSRPDGLYAFQVGQAGGALYFWEPDIAEWLAWELIDYDYTLVDYINGDESSAQLTSDGWTVTTGNGGTVTSTTDGIRDYVTLATTNANNATANITRSWASGAGMYCCGYVQCSGAVGTITGTAAMVPYMRNGSRIYHAHGLIGAPGVRCVNGTSAVGGIGATDSLTTVVWLEVLVIPAGPMYIRTNRGPWTQLAGAAQLGASASTDIFYGDSTTSGGGLMLLSELKIISLSS